MVLQLESRVEDKAISSFQKPLPERVKRRSNLDALTSLRFFAALSIVLLHAQGMGLISLLPSGQIANSLSQAVCFFFVLSGFVLAYRYKSLSTPKEILLYLGNRFARIAPLYYLTAIPFLCVPALMNFVSSPTTEILRYAFALQDYYRNALDSCIVNSPAHSVSSEVLYYLIFPFLLLAKRSRLVLIAGLVIAAFAIVPRIVPGISAITSLPAVSCVPFFMGGIVSHELFAKFQPTLQTFARNNPHRRWCFTVLEMAVLISCVPLCILMIAPSIFTQEFEFLTFQFAPVSFVVVSLIAGFSLVTFTFALEIGRISQALKKPFMVALGAASYSLFLVHYCILKLFVFLSKALPDSFAQVLGWISVAFCITISIIVHRTVEEPLRKHLTKRFHRIIMNSPAVAGEHLAEHDNPVSLSEFCKQMGLRFVLPALLVCGFGFAAPHLAALYAAWDNPAVETRWKDIKQTVIPGSTNILFGDTVELVGAKQVTANGSTVLSTLWKARQEVRSDLGFLATHVLNEKGEIICNLDHKLTPASTLLHKGQLWEDVCVIPSNIAAAGCGLALYDDVKKMCAKVVGGKTDWDGRRLVISLAQNAGR